MHALGVLGSDSIQELGGGPFFFSKSATIDGDAARDDDDMVLTSLLRSLCATVSNRLKTP